MQNVYTLTILKINNDHSLREIAKKCLSAGDCNFFFQICNCGLCNCENKHSLRLEVVTNLVNKNDEHIRLGRI